MHWLNRGDDPILRDMCLHVYSMWVYRAEKPPPPTGRKRRRAEVEHDDATSSDVDSEDGNTASVEEDAKLTVLTIDFAEGYKLHGAFVQRISTEPRIP